MITPQVKLSQLIRSDQRGVAVIEFALILPVLLMLLLASAELGRAFYQYNTLTKAVRDGARYLSDNALNGAGVIDLGSGITAATKNMVVFGNSAGSGSALLDSLTINDITINTVDTRHLKVTASFTYTPIFAAGIPTFGADSQTISTAFTLQSATTVRAL